MWSKTIMEGFLEELQPEVKPKTLESWSCRYSPLLVSSCPVNSLTSEPHLIFLLTIHGIINALALNSKFLFPENGLNLPPLPTPALSLPSSHTQGTCYALNTSRIFYPSAFGQVMPFALSGIPSPAPLYLNYCLFLIPQLLCPNFREVSTLRSLTHTWGELHAKLDLVGFSLFGVIILYRLGYRLIA